MRELSTGFITALAVALATSASAQAAKPAAKPAAPKAPAAAPPASPVEGDARCLLSMALLSQDKQRQQAANIGVYFFTGRLSARGANVQAAVKAAEAKLVPAQIPAELQRCGPVVQAGMKSLQETFSPQQGAPGAAAAPAPAPAPAAPAPAAPAAPPPK
jgi:hypothetical protein